MEDYKSRMRAVIKKAKEMNEERNGGRGVKRGKYTSIDPKVYEEYKEFSKKMDLEMILAKGTEMTKDLDAFADKLAQEKATDEEFKKYMDNEKGKESKEVGEKEK